MYRRIIGVMAMLGSTSLAAIAAPQTAPPIATFSAPTQAVPTQTIPSQDAPLRIDVAPASRSAESTPLDSGSPSPIALRPLADESPASESPVNHPIPQLAENPPIQTVSYESPLPLQAADQMLQLVAVQPGTGGSAGTPVSLRDAMRLAPSDQRLALTRGYWRCFEAQALLATARYIESQINQLSGGSSLDGPLVQAERAIATAAIADAESVLREAQVQLLRYIPPRPDRTMPLPSSLPLVSEYLTNYETLAARRGLDPRLQGIDLRLVEGLANLTALAESAWQTRDLLARFISAFNQEQKNLAETMQAIATCRRAHEAFYHAVALYNQDIASYAFAVAPSSLPADQAVAMLIKVDREPSSSSTRQADATSVLSSGSTPTVTANASLGAMSIDRSAGGQSSATALNGNRIPGPPPSSVGLSNGPPPIVTSAGSRPTAESASPFPTNSESANRSPGPSPFQSNSLNSPSASPPPTSATIQFGSPNPAGGSPPAAPPSSQPPTSSQPLQPKPSSSFPILGR